MFLFVHPQTGHRSRLLVSAAWGQGEGIVSVRNTDEFVWDKSKGELEHTVADKDTIFIGTKAHSGTEKNRPRRINAISGVSPKRSSTLSVNGLAHLEGAFGYPLDIEWALAGESILFKHAPSPLSLPPTKMVPLWSGITAISKRAIGVTTPMTFTYAQRGYLSAYQQTMEAMGITKKIEAPHRGKTCSVSFEVGSITIQQLVQRPHCFHPLGKTKRTWMMGLKDPVDFVEDMFVLKGAKTSSPAQDVLSSSRD